MMPLPDGDEEEDREGDEEEVSDEEDLGDALLERTKSAFDGIFNKKVWIMVLLLVCYYFSCVVRKPVLGYGNNKATDHASYPHSVVNVPR